LIVVFGFIELYLVLMSTSFTHFYLMVVWMWYLLSCLLKLNPACK